MANGADRSQEVGRKEVLEAEASGFSPVINIDNKGAQIRIDWKHIIVAFGLLTSAMSTVGFGAVFFMPARQTDMDALTKSVTQLQGSLNDLGQALTALNVAVEKLQKPRIVTIERPVKKNPPRVSERAR